MIGNFDISMRQDSIKIFTRQYFRNCIFVGVSEKMALTTSQLLKVRVSRAKTCLDLWNGGEPCVSQTPKVIRLIWPITCYNSSPWAEFGFGNFRAAAPQSYLHTWLLTKNSWVICACGRLWVCTKGTYGVWSRFWKLAWFWLQYLCLVILMWSKILSFETLRFKIVIALSCYIQVLLYKKHNWYLAKKWAIPFFKFWLNH